MKTSVLASLVLVSACHGSSASPSDTDALIASSTASAEPAEDPTTRADSCGPFGGRIHGEITCVHVDLASGAHAPITTHPQRSAETNKKCGDTVVVGARTLVIRCTSLPHANDEERPVDIAFEERGADGGSVRSIAIAHDDELWDLIHLTVVPKGDAVDVGIDYVVLDK